MTSRNYRPGTRPPGVDVSSLGSFVEREFVEIARAIQGIEGAGGPVAWDDITGKPTSFPSTWGSVSGKPTTFAPEVTAGSYTPTMNFITLGDLTVSYTLQQGRYVLVGRLLFVYVRLTFVPTWTTASGAFRFTLPYAASPGDTASLGLTAMSGFSWPTGRTMIMGTINGGSAFGLLNAFGTAALHSTLNVSNLVSGASHQLGVSGVYSVPAGAVPATPIVLDPP